MNNPLNEISQVYLSQVDESYRPLSDKQKDKMLDKARLQDDPIKASALRTAVDVDDIKKKPRNTIFKKKKQLHMGEDSDHDKEVAKYREQAKKKTTMPSGDVGHDIHKRAVAQYNKQNPSKKVAESYSNWRVDLQELVVGNPPPAAMDKDIATNAKPKTSTKARQEIKEKPEGTVNNEVKINPVMRESFEALGGEVLEVVDLTEERAKTREEARRKLEANRRAIEAGRPEDSPYGKHLRKKLKSPSEYRKDPWSTHPDDAKAHAKEETELDERSLTDGEKDEKEKYVRGMKKSVEGFKKRYGDRAKSVMYATATKMAKEGYDMDMAADVFLECGYEPEEFIPVLEDAIMGAE